MTTLAEKIASLSPEHREMVERKAKELIAQERDRRARKAGVLLKHRLSVVKGQRFVLVAKRSYVRKASVGGVRKRGYIQVRRVGLDRLQGAGHRRYLSVLR